MGIFRQLGAHCGAMHTLKRKKGPRLQKFLRLLGSVQLPDTHDF